MIWTCDCKSCNAPRYRSPEVNWTTGQVVNWGSWNANPPIMRGDA